MNPDDNISFEQALTRLLNEYSMDAECNTPDYALANYLINCVRAYISTKKFAEYHWKN